MRKHKGFTLVELVVVVMILGILAAVAAPKLLNTSSAATENGLKQSLAVVRDAIERYAAEHGGELPGGPSADEETFKEALKEYLRGGELPVCPVAGENNNVEVVTDVVPSGEPDEPGKKSWKYSKVSGHFICNSTTATKENASVTYDML